MVLDLDPPERDKSKECSTSWKTHPEKLRALVAENIKLRQFVSLVRKFRPQPARPGPERP